MQYPFSQQNSYSFSFDQFKTFSFIKTIWGSLEQIPTNYWHFAKKIFFLKIVRFSWSSDYNSPKTWSLQPIHIWMNIHFSRQILMHWLPSTLIFSKMLRFCIGLYINAHLADTLHPKGDVTQNFFENELGQEKLWFCSLFRFSKTYSLKLS